jgi:hypothetical protein
VELLDLENERMVVVILGGNVCVHGGKGIKKYFIFFLVRSCFLCFSCFTLNQKLKHTNARHRGVKSGFFMEQLSAKLVGLMSENLSESRIVLVAAMADLLVEQLNLSRHIALAISQKAYEEAISK